MSKKLPPYPSNTGLGLRSLQDACSPCTTTITTTITATVDAVLLTQSTNNTATTNFKATNTLLAADLMPNHKRERVRNRDARLPLPTTKRSGVETWPSVDAVAARSKV